MTFNPDNPNEHAEDPFAVAETAKPMGREFYGQVDIHAWFCALVKGQGKVPFDPQQHNRRCTAIDITITPLADSGLSFSLERSMIAESKEWANIVWASAKAHGMSNPRELQDQWVKAVQEPTGRTYRSDGVEKEATTIKFVEIYNSEDECRKAYYEETSATPPDDLGSTPIPGFDDEPAGDNGNGDGGNDDSERQTALAFLEALAKQNNWDVAVISDKMSNYPMLADRWEPNSDALRQQLDELRGE